MRRAAPLRNLGYFSRVGSLFRVNLPRKFDPYTAPCFVQQFQGLSTSAGFPGSPQSSTTKAMEWIDPSRVPRIPSYSVMDLNSCVEDEAQVLDHMSQEQVLQWYKNMLTVNVMDGIMFDAQRHGRLSFYMPSAGEEALMVGSAAALEPSDVITCQYREHGVFLQRGFTLKDFMSQMTSNCNDPGKGRNMPVHYSGKKQANIHAVASTLGTQIPHAVGAAYALKMDAIDDPEISPSVAAVYFGEGAASEGDFHGALNFAATQECPVIFICRNNGFAISTPAAEQYRGDGIASRGAGYGIESLRVDGTDVFAVYKATKEARRKALEGRPILLEFMSYRESHHSTSDDSFAYRTRDEVKFWKSEQRNPLTRLLKWLISKDVITFGENEQLRKQIRIEVVKELMDAEKEKKPELISIFSDVYSELTEEMEEQRQELKRLMQNYPEEYDHDNHVGGIDRL